MVSTTLQYRVRINVNEQHNSIPVRTASWCTFAPNPIVLKWINSIVVGRYTHTVFFSEPCYSHPWYEITKWLFSYTCPMKYSSKQQTVHTSGATPMHYSPRSSRATRSYIGTEHHA